MRLFNSIRMLTESPRFYDEERALARTMLTQQLTDAGWLVEERPFEIAGVYGSNLVALGAPRARVLLGAHYDTVEISPGADDNASGVAAVLEIARVLGPNAPVDIVLFDLEEPQGSVVGPEGRSFAYGSQAFVDAGVSYDIVFILESLGHRCNTDGCQQLPRGMPQGLVDVDGTAVYWITGGGDTTAPWADLVATFTASAAPTRAVGVSIPGRGLIQETRFSDHAPFWDVGIAAAMITDTALLRNPHYHRASDTWDTIDLGFLADATRGTAVAVAAAAGMCGP